MNTAMTGAVGPQPDTDAGAALRFLVVDDDQVNRLVLTAMLTHAGHTVVQASNGAEAVAVFEAGRPDMVLMDVMMPVMDGYEATRLIKRQAGDQFVPVIFLTALQDEESLARCIEAGGEDFLTKPFSRVILQAKIGALLRLRTLTRRLERQREVIAGHHARLREEQQVAERLFRKIVHRGSLGTPGLQYLISPAALFNGDLLLAARHPSGSLMVLLGDFAGHGLPAAVGAIPVSEIFYVMTAKGYSIGEIVGEINRKLRAVLPAGQFLAACLLELEGGGRRLNAWNGGIPDLLVRSAGGRLQRLPSRHLPLGVLGNDALDRHAEGLDLGAGDRLYLYTDGVIEAPGPGGERFGQARLEETLAQAEPYAALCARLSAWRGTAEQDDDITLIEIAADAAANSTADPDGRVVPRTPGRWQLTLELGVDALRAADPLPAALQMVMELQGLYDHRERLYVVLSELFNNALDHGLLRLDSMLKATPQGFSAYYAAREQALAALGDGRIRIELTHRPQERGGRLMVQVTDSGTGFHRDAPPQPDARPEFAGRGLALVRSLCREIVIHGSGNRVEAVYDWS